MTVELVDVFNIALERIGLKQLDTAQDDENSARVLSKAWPSFRRKFFYDHHWNGCGRPLPLNQLDGSDDAALFQFDQPAQWRLTYDLPSDYIRIRSINPSSRSVSDEQWELGLLPGYNYKILYSNVPIVEASYTADVGNEVYLLSDQMVWALGLGLASHTGRILASGPIDVQQIKQESEDALVDSKGSEGQEASMRRLSNEGPLIRAKFRHGGFPRF